MNLQVTITNNLLDCPLVGRRELMVADIPILCLNGLTGDLVTDGERHGHRLGQILTECDEVHDRRAMHLSEVTPSPPPLQCWMSYTLLCTSNAARAEANALNSKSMWAHYTLKPNDPTLSISFQCLQTVDSSLRPPTYDGHCNQYWLPYTFITPKPQTSLTRMSKEP